MRLLILAVSLSALVACRDTTAPEITVTGSWSGTASGGVSISVVLSQSGDSVTGTGQLMEPAGSFALSVAGTYVKPAVALTFTGRGFTWATFTSSAVSATTMLGTLTKYDNSSESVTLTKH